MGEIIIKVPGAVKEVIEISNFSIIQQILDLKTSMPRKNWKEKFKEKDNLLINDVFEDEDLEWWEW
jgi:hypothetical protein